MISLPPAFQAESARLKQRAVEAIDVLTKVLNESDLQNLKSDDPKFFSKLAQVSSLLQDANRGFFSTGIVCSLIIVNLR